MVCAFGHAIEQYHTNYVDMFFFRLNDLFSKEELSSNNLSSYTLLAAGGLLQS